MQRYLNQTNLKNTGNRNTIFEIMRLTAMFMIVFEHCLLSTALYSSTPLSHLDNISWLLEAFTICAVNLFFLISGYFLKSNQFRISRLLKIWIRVIFYSLSIYLTAVWIGVETISIKALIAYTCPVTFKQYWFMQTYIVLFLVSPFIAVMLEHLKERQHLALCIILLIFFSLHQTFIPVSRTLDTTQGYGFLWGGTLIIIGNFLWKYGRTYLEKINLFLCLAGYITVACGIFLSNYLIVRFHIAQGLTSRTNFYAYNSISVFLESLFLFCFFIKLSSIYRDCHNRFVNWIAKSSLAVYLISSHPILLYPLWSDIWRTQCLLWMPVVYFGAAVFETLVVFALCILIDKFCCFLCHLLKIEAVLRKLNKMNMNHIFNNKNNCRI